MTLSHMSRQLNVENLNIQFKKKGYASTYEFKKVVDFDRFEIQDGTFKSLAKVLKSSKKALKLSLYYEM